MKPVSEILKQARREAGLTQAELARRSATSQSAVAAYESGAKMPSVPTLDRLLGVAGVELGASLLPRTVTSPEKGRGRLLKRLRDHHAEIVETAKEHGATNVRIFGSIARGDENDESDIDLLVDSEPGFSLLDQVRLRRALIELLGVDVDVVTSNGLLQRDSHILDEAVAI